MLTGKQRSFLKSLTNTMKPVTQLGKEGVTEAFLIEVDHLLEHHELIKISVLNNSMCTAKEAANEIAEKTDAEFVQAIGNRFTLYRQSRTNPTLEIPGADNSRVHNNRLKQLQVEREKQNKMQKQSTGKRIRKSVKPKTPKTSK
ncbi:ribosome assembly RNA-binding protein YhbY [Fusibacter paucivorans]|uniref:Ribosome assembly RNA-binding protein YhbY n=1 Tax=Fusibacter paucivorans TaxID=76009 RepID=A0ABS5PNS3_9FIRM|nr:ribosome assembly RNA-binding protein YhbY [Fusibacter paucivorans]MBS7526820.1 ribosome assembly RNA-binding protein YhbY [Fusibacter paucivorans]